MIVTAEHQERAIDKYLDSNPTALSIEMDAFLYGYLKGIEVAEKLRIEDLKRYKS